MLQRSFAFSVHETSIEQKSFLSEPGSEQAWKNHRLEVRRILYNSAPVYGLAHHALTLHQISSTEPADIALIPAISRIHLSAWLTNSLYKAIYYGPSSSYPGIIEANRQRHFRSFTTNPSTRFALVVDDEVESNEYDSILENKEQRIKPSQVIAWVKYCIFESSQAAEDRKDTGERIWPSYTNLAIVVKFWDLVVASRQRQSKEIGPHISVDLLATDPKHHRRGAGRMLMQHVVKRPTNWVS
jgi:ribosomal protein S18 acetylase RimI-like enzyme